MAIIDLVRLPENIERGARGGPRFLTTILTAKSGHEIRNIDWQRARGRWNVGYGISEREDLQAIIDFFYARAGRGRAFLFKDWTDYTLDRAVVKELTEGRRLVKEYTSGGVTYERVISCPIPDVCEYFTSSGDTNGTPLADAQIDRTTGAITLPAGYEVSGEFDVPARFDVDDLDVNLDWINAGSIPSLPITEVRL